MNESDRMKFVELVTLAMSGYAKPVGDLKVWWSFLKDFPLRVVEMSFNSYMDDDDKFAPIPVAIAKRCKLQDGRPGVEEAWSIAIKTCNESDTVIWTHETAEAFHQCSAIYAIGDEVGARMAFKETYTRLVSEARQHGVAPKWSILPGTDKAILKSVTDKAVALGLIKSNHEYLGLPAPDERQQNTLLLEGKGAGEKMTYSHEERMKLFRAALEKLESPLDKFNRINEQKRLSDAEIVAGQKRRLDEMTRDALNGY